MSQGEEGKCTKKKKKVKGGSTEEMKDKANSLLKVDTEDMRKCRGMSQEEMDQCWKNLVEKMEAEVLDKYKIEDSKREVFEGRHAPLEWRRESRWWVTELLAAGCEKAWVHPGWEDTMQVWYDWLVR